MQDRLLTLDRREFVLAPWDGANHSGYEPLDDKVLVLMDAHAEKTAGGIIITDTGQDRHNMASESGVIVAIGPAAFRWNDDLTREWVGEKPLCGDRVSTERYAGQMLNGMDGRQYRLMSQKCVGAIMVGYRDENGRPRIVAEPEPVAVPEGFEVIG